MLYDESDCETGYDRFLWYLEDYINDPDLNFRMKDALELATEFGIDPYDWWHFELELERRFPKLLED